MTAEPMYQWPDGKYRMKPFVPLVYTVGIERGPGDRSIFPQAIHRLFPSARAVGGQLLDVRNVIPAEPARFSREALCAEFGQRYERCQAFTIRRSDEGQPVEIADIPAGLARLREVLAMRRSPILLCPCGLTYPRCHRSVVAAAVCEAGLPVGGELIWQ